MNARRQRQRNRKREAISSVAMAQARNNHSSWGKQQGVGGRRVGSWIPESRRDWRDVAHAVRAGWDVRKCTRRRVMTTLGRLIHDESASPRLRIAGTQFVIAVARANLRQ